MKNLTQVSSPFRKKIIKIHNINNKFFKCVFNFVAFLLFSNNFLQAQAQIEAPRPDFRRSDWVDQLNDGAPVTRDFSGEDWWYGHCNAYKNNEFVGYMSVGFSRPQEYFPAGLLGDCVDPLEVLASYQNPSDPNTPINDCVGTSFSAIGLIDKSGDYRRMFKMLNYSYEDLYSVIQTSDGNFVAVGYVLGTRDVNAQPMVYNPTIGNSPVTFPNNFICTLDAQNRKISQFHSYVIKFDIDGNILWQHIYGSYNPINNSQSELSRAYYNGGQAFDLMEVNSNRIRVVGYELNDETPAQKYIKRPYILDIDADGNVLNKTYINNFRYQQHAVGSKILGICKVTNSQNADRFAICGANYYRTEGIVHQPEYQYGDCYTAQLYNADDGTYTNKFATLQSFADVLTFDGTNYNHDWQTPFIFHGFNERKLTISNDIKTLTDGDIIVSSLLYKNGCGYANPNEADGRIHRLKPNGTIANVVNLGVLAAFDLKVGLTETPDGGYAAVSTRHSPNTPAFEEGEMDETIECYSEGVQYYDENTNSDAYFARFNAQNNKLWETSFNTTDYFPVVSTADNPKQQECMYSITQCPEDGSFVAVGNNSYNMDDDYIVKLKSDCSLFETFDIDGNEDAPYAILTDETWNTSKKIRGPVIV